MRRAQQGPGVALGDAVGLAMPLVGPWQYQCSRWVVHPPPPSIPLPGTHLARTPGYPLSSVTPRVTTVAGHPGTCTYDRFWTIVGDPRGVKRTGTYGDHRGHAWAVSPLAPPYAHALRPAPQRLLRNKPQYISVYLRISQNISVFSNISVFLSISQYFPVFQLCPWSPVARPSCRSMRSVLQCSARGY